MSLVSHRTLIALASLLARVSSPIRQRAVRAIVRRDGPYALHACGTGEWRGANRVRMGHVVVHGTVSLAGSASADVCCGPSVARRGVRDPLVVVDSARLRRWRIANVPSRAAANGGALAPVDRRVALWAHRGNILRRSRRAALTRPSTRRGACRPAARGSGACCLARAHRSAFPLQYSALSLRAAARRSCRRPGRHRATRRAVSIHAASRPA